MKTVFPLLHRCTFTALCLLTILSRSIERAEAELASEAELPKKPYNILLIICDQEQYQLLSAPGYSLKARETLAKRGVSFRNHYVASAMCSPSRAAMLTGQPPQCNGVFDQMEYAYVPTLDPAIPTVGTILKKLGYSTAYFGKFELNKSILTEKDTVNYSTALIPYGFDTFAANGDVASSPDSGYKNDFFTAGETVRFLRSNELKPSSKTKPFFLVTSLLNPHDIMYANANLDGKEVQKGLAHAELTLPPKNSLYQKTWTFDLPSSLSESLTKPGMPTALAEYYHGWSGALGYIPTNRPDMWKSFNNYYLNLMRDNDRTLQQIIDVLEETNLWENTIVILTADHGEMGGSHGGLRGKGPFAYEEHAKVPFIIVHPEFPPGESDVLTSHLDLLPTIVGLSGLPASQCKEAVKNFPGKDFSGTLADNQRKNVHAIRQGILFNYVAPLTIDQTFCTQCVSSGSGAAAKAAINLASLKPHLGKRGFLTFAFDGRYKFARYYAPNAFNTPKTIQEILQYNDIQLFDLQTDPKEMKNLALHPEQNAEVLLRMNGLLNDLMAKEVGNHNNGNFLPKVIRPTGEVTFQR